MDRAIVTEIEGTTRDALEENINIHGVSLNVVDTAGIRDTENIVEKIGIEKSISYAKDADLLIYVVDLSKPLDNNDKEIIDILKGRKNIVLLNKTDLEENISHNDLKEIENIDSYYKIKISAKTGDGIDEVEKAIKDMFFDGQIDFNDQVFLTNARQKHCISQAYESVCMVEQSILDDMPEDFFTIDLMKAYEELGKVIGEAVEDDLVDRIFSSFCMGK